MSLFVRRKRDEGKAQEDERSPRNAAESSFRHYTQQAWKARTGYWLSEVGLVVAGAGVPVSTVITSDPIAPAVLGGGVVVLTGMRRIFNWQENWVRFTATCAILRAEWVRFEHHLEPYHNIQAEAKNEAHLAMRVCEIEEPETQGWLVLRETKESISQGATRATRQPCE